MLFMVCVSAFVPFVWVMVVGCGVSGWRVFQCRVAVVSASRRVPGVVLGFGVWACSGVAWLWVPGVCVCVLVVATCVAWFRMLMCVAPLSCFLFCLLFG